MYFSRGGINFNTLFVSERLAHRARVEDPNFNIGVGLTTDCKEMLDFGMKIHRADHDSFYLYRCDRGDKMEEARSIFEARKAYIQTSNDVTCKGSALEGQPSDRLPEIVTKDQIDILMLQAPDGIHVSAGMKRIFFKCEGALLVFKGHIKSKRKSVYE
mmetsp:Transcript_25189/g.34715  ORF Transcript_25189/g.34715 Transcript_25189/m.34715 type:complete len:158 (-) Transcript_25189:153-626(-)